MIGREDNQDNSELNADTKQHPIKHSFCVSLRRDVHWKSLILSLLIYGCLVAIAWCRLAVITTVVVYYNRYISQKEVSKNSPCADGYIYIPIAFVVLLYLVYLVECWHCHTRIELKYKVDVQTVYHKMRQMREALPIVWWKAMCYHYVRRTRQVTRYRNGDAFTSTQVYYERVNSHTAGCAFNFTNCGIKDVTKCVTGLEDFPATKIRFSKSYSFENPEAKYEFDEQRNQFFVENERRDDYMETREGMDLLNVNFKEYMIAFKDPDNLPWYVSHVVFWLASCLLLTWPLRVIIEYKTAYIHYHTHKVFGTNYSNTDRHSNGEHMPRVNTIASADLELLVRNNFSVVPSYSEAMLMGANATSTHTLHDANANVTSPVLGPTRSITWNNISACSSSGYISGLFTSTTLSEMPQYNSCMLVNDGILLQSDPEQQQQGSISNSLRSVFRSPWNRKRKRPQTPGTVANRMFMLSSPESPDDYAITINQNTNFPTVHVTRTNSTLNHQSPTGISGGTGNHSFYSLVSNHSSHCQRPYNLNSHTSPDESRDCVGVNRETVAEINIPKHTPESNVAKNQSKCLDNTKPIRPNSILKNVKQVALDNGVFRAENTYPTCPARPVFIKSNLPTVPISNILNEKSPNREQFTPSSPPCYEAALNMQTLRAAAQHVARDEPLSETQTLINEGDRSRRRYYSLMETSL